MRAQHLDPAGQINGRRGVRHLDEDGRFATGQEAWPGPFTVSRPTDRGFGVAAAALSASGPEGTNGHPGLLQSGADGPGDGHRTGGVPVDAH